MTATTPPSVDAQAARHFLELLGVDPAACWFRTLTPNKGANVRRRDHDRPGWAADLHGFSAAELAADCRAGGSIYLITGSASTASGRNQKGQPTGCVIDDDITGCHSLFIEWDDIPIADQLIAWQTLAMPEPTVMVLTGGKSVHTYWALQEPIDPTTWRAITARLIAYCQSDSSCSNPSRLMRLPGGVYFDKKTGRATGQATIIHESGHRYFADEIEQAIAAGEVRKLGTFDFTTPPESMAGVAIPTDDRPRREFPIRTMEEVRDALACIPRRVGGGDDSYGRYRNILWGLIKACEEAGFSREVAISLMETHSPSKSCNWNIQQTAGSGGEQIESRTFWWHARDAGWRPRPEERSTATQASTSTARTSQPTPQPIEVPKDQQIQGLLDELLDLMIAPQESWAKQQATRAALWALGVQGGAIDERIYYALAQRWSLPLQTSHAGGSRNRKLSDPMSSPAEDLLPGFLLWRRDHLLFGAGGTGKTLAAAQMAICLIKGLPFLDQQIAPSRTGRVLWIGTDGGEGARAMVREYVEDLGLEADDPDIESGLTIWSAEGADGLPSWACTPSGLQELRDELETGDYALVVIDSLKAVLELAGINFSIGPVGTLMRLMQALVGRYCSLLWLHHPAGGKAAGKGLQAAAGSQNINQIPSAVHQITRKVEDRGPSNLWSVHKLRGSTSREFSYRLAEAGFEITDGQITANVRVAVLDAIELLNAGGMPSGTSYIASNLPTFNDSTIRNNLTWLRKRGLIRKKGSDWSMTPAGTDLLDDVKHGKRDQIK